MDLVCPLLFIKDVWGMVLLTLPFIVRVASLENRYNFHIHLVRLILFDHLTLFIQMYGVLHLFLLRVVTSIMLFIDGHSRYTWIYFMLCSICQSFVQMVHTQFSTAIRVFCSDSGGEYLNDAFHQFFVLRRSHAQNGVAERRWW